MIKFNFSETYKVAEKQYNLGTGEYFKINKPRKRIRLISECLPHESEYKGDITFKWLCQVIDREDGTIKPFFMPNTIYRAIESLQFSDEYAFDEVPMPYDITIVATGTLGTKEVRYSLEAARNNTELTSEEIQKIKDAPTVREVQAKVKDNEKQAKTPETPEVITAENSPINNKDIPF